MHRKFSMQNDEEVWYPINVKAFNLVWHKKKLFNEWTFSRCITFNIKSNYCSLKKSQSINLFDIPDVKAYCGVLCIQQPFVLPAIAMNLRFLTQQVVV